MVERSAGNPDAILTIPNLITIFRFLGTPLFVWLVLVHESYGWGVTVLAIMGGTDWVDGYVARKLNQASHLGRIMDPVADRVALVAVVVTMVIAELLPLWLLLLLLIPDVILLGVTILLFHGDAGLKVTLLGKTRTAALMVGTPLLLLAEALDADILRVAAWVILAAGMAMHVVAFSQYLWAVLHLPRPARGAPETAVPQDPSPSGERP